MRTVDIYEIGEEVYIKAKIDEVLIENGEPKYRLAPEGAASPLAHKYTHHELKPVPPMPKKEDKPES